MYGILTYPSMSAQNKGNFQGLMNYFSKKDSDYFLWADLIVILYAILFILWLLHFTYKICNSLIRSYLYPDVITKLHTAAYNNDTLSMLKLAEEYPNAINIPIDKDKFTPFLRACYHGNTQVVKYMLQIGANVESRTSRNENAIYLAAYNRIKNRDSNDASCIHALYHGGVDINAVNNNNLNVLQLAAMFGHTPLVKWLLSKNANYLVDPSPHFLAKSAGHHDTADLLSELEFRKQLCN